MKKGFVCFDLDNTLIRSNQCHLHAYQLAFKKNLLHKKIPNTLILRYFGEGSKKIVRCLFPSAPSSFILQIMKDHDLFVRKQTAKEVVIIPGARAVLSSLRKKWKLGLVSNCNRNTILSLLQAAHIPRHWFSIIVGQDQVRHPKPAPDELLKAQHMLHMKPDYLVGDSIYDIRAGKRSKVRVLAVASGIHTQQQLLKERPFAVCTKLQHILSFLQ